MDQLNAIYTLPEILSFSFEQWSLIFILGILWAIIAWVMNASIALNDFSFKEILRQTRVIFVVVGGVVFLGETLSSFDIFGIGAIIVSAIVISWRKTSLRQHMTSKPILLAWLSALLVAIATLLEKQVVMDVDVLTYAFLGAFALPTIFLLLFLNKTRRAACAQLLTNHKIEITLFSSFMLVAFVAGLFVYQMLPISITYPLIQSATVFSVLIGTTMFEGNHHWKRKVVADIIAIVGVIHIQIP